MLPELVPDAGSSVAAIDGALGENVIVTGKLPPGGARSGPAGQSRAGAAIAGPAGQAGIPAQRAEDAPGSDGHPAMGEV